MTPTPPKSRLSRQLALRYVMRHPIAFREHFVPRVSRRRFWHRYAFTPVILAMQQGDTTFMAGRGSGKSFAVLEPDLVHYAINHPGEESMITSFRKVHVMDRMERAIDYFEEIPLFRLYKSRIVRSPSYIVETRHGHSLYGISVGDDPEARMAQGKHVARLILEESQQYPERAWLKLQGAKDPRGCRTLMAGVPDGHLDTPFRQADGELKTFASRRFRLSRRHDPFFDQDTKASFADTLGGEGSDNFKQEVDAQWGHPLWSAWDLEKIYACMDKALPVEVERVSGKRYAEQGWGPQDAIRRLSGPRAPGRPIRISMDVGYSQPSSVGIWEYEGGRWWLIARLELVERMEHDDQGAVMDALGKKYHAQAIGIDTTEGEGRAIAHDLEIKYGWAGAIKRCTFNETLLAGWTPAPELKEVWEPMRSIGTRMLRTFFASQNLALPLDENIPNEFNQEMESRNADGTTRIVTPPKVHITDMMRVFGIMHFMDQELVMPEADTDFVTGEWGARQSPWAPHPASLY